MSNQPQKSICMSIDQLIDAAVANKEGIIASNVHFLQLLERGVQEALKIDLL